MRNEIFTEKELNLLKAEAQEHLDSPYVLMSELTLLTGLRVGEVCALKTEDVKDYSIHICRKQVRRPHD